MTSDEETAQIQHDVEFTIPGTFYRPPMTMRAVHGRPDSPESGDLWHDGETAFMVDDAGGNIELGGVTNG